ncbi:MAG: M14 family metallocarboxypeptidase [Verrucomicrobiota bacterium]
MQTHRAHDYRFLIRRWQTLARVAQLRLRILVRQRGIPIFFLRTRALKAKGGVYISAGIHGDEAASTEALIGWAEQNAERLRSLPLMLFPCLNPWGLARNCRFDERGVDLNRVFHLDTTPMIENLKRVVAPYQFELALMLHEDFDAQGLYLYEIERERPSWGESLLNVARPIIPIEGRTRVDGRKATDGLIRRRFAARKFLQMGYPEAIWLHANHSRRAFTLETPSEFALEQRIRAQVAVINECVNRAAPLPKKQAP